MMIGNSRKGYHQGGKQEEDDTSNTAHHHHHHQQQHTSNNSTTDKLYDNSKVVGFSSSSSRQWSGLRNPRIVRVSRSFGGKDRHSKVCTIRGLRDRRIRLSVPTAIQLYELQDRLGLNQPSKVIDWLIEATKQDIDKLPPLPIPLGFPQFHPQLNQTLLLPPPPPPDHHHHHHQSSFGANFFDAANTNNNNSSTSFIDKGKWVMKTNNEEGEGGIGGASGSAQNPFPSGNYNNNPFHSDQPSNFLSLFGSHGVFPNNSNDHNHHHQEEVNPGHSSSVQFPPSATNAPSSLFAPYYAAPYSSVSLEADPRMQQLNHIQFMMTSSSNNSHPLVLPSLMKPLIPTPPFSSRLLDSNDHQKDTSTHHPS